MRGRQWWTGVPWAGMVAVLLIGAGASATAAVQETTQPTACDRAIALVEEGKLEDAETVAEAIGGSCPETVGGLADEARAASDALVERAERASEDTERERLATLALALDSGNGEAQALLEDEEVEQRTEPCAQADAAVEDGEFARAEALYTALEGNESAKDCRQAGLEQLALARTGAWPQRFSDAVTQDGALQLLLGVIAFGLGVVFTAWYRLPDRYRLERGGVAGLLALALLGHVTYLLSGGSRGSDLGWLLLVLVLTFVAGAALATYGRRRAPVRIEVSTEGEGAHDASAVARQTLAELHRLGSGPSDGIYAIDGTDLHETGIRGVLGAVDHPWLNTLLKVWDAIILRAGDRVVLTTTATTGSLAMYEGRQLVRTSVVDTASFRTEPEDPTEDSATAEDEGKNKATTPRDSRELAIGLAAHILWWRLEHPEAEPRLYGASSPEGLTLATIAGERLADGDFPAARVLAARGTHRDPGNRAAALAGISADLRDEPSDAVEDLRLAQLVELLEREEELAGSTETPLLWRLRYTLATGLVNRAVRRDSELEGGAWGADFRAALQLWATFLTPEQKAGLPLPQAAISQMPPSTDHPDEEGFLAYLARASHSAAVSIAVALTAPPDTAPLDAWSLAGSRTDQQNLACGYATAYHLTDAAAGERRNELAQQCVTRIRLAAPEARHRESVLKDPFLSWVEGSEPYAQLLQEWELAGGAYAGIQSFGSLAARIVVDYPDPGDLLAALQSWPSREALRTTYQVDDTILRQWRGAAEWLVAGRKADLIDRFQRAGFRDRTDVIQTAAPAVAARLAARAQVDGVSPPTAEQQLEMSAPV